MSTSSSSTPVVTVTEVTELKRQLESQKSLAFDLTNERDDLLQQVLRLTGVYQGDVVDELNRSRQEIESQSKRIRQQEDAISELREKIVEAELDSSRMEEKKKQLSEMQQEMETLQAVVVLQTANLTMQKEPEAEIARLQSELQFQQQVTKEAEARAEMATIQREEALAELEVTQKALAQGNLVTEDVLSTRSGFRSRLSNFMLGVDGANVSQSELIMRHIRATAELEKENRQLRNAMQLAQKQPEMLTVTQLTKSSAPTTSKSTSGFDGEKVKQLKKQNKTLKKSLAKATAALAEAYISDDPSQLQDHHRHLLADAKSKLTIAQDALLRKDAELERLTAQLNFTRQQLEQNTAAIRHMTDQAQVQVTVKKETIHTREKRTGQMVPIHRVEDTSSVVWFTDSRTHTLKTGPWAPSEDRILLQAQMQFGTDWVEIAKLIPGRTDEAIAQRWDELSSTMLSDMGLEDDDDEDEDYEQPIGLQISHIDDVDVPGQYLGEVQSGKGTLVPISDRAYEAPTADSMGHVYETVPHQSHHPQLSAVV
eukprot:m.360310 g.360310  ORF g.360310 m.360310 type:complete len:540 (-) comp18960_c0_seq1:316-1935(-)